MTPPTDTLPSINELTYLLTDTNARLKKFERDLANAKKHVHPDVFLESQIAAHTYRENIAAHLQKISACRDPAKSLIFIDQALRDTREYLRTHMALIGALITSTDWQSPAFAYSLRSQAGRETGKIYATKNDYKRDQHWDAYHYEQMFTKQYIDTFMKLPAHIYATSSGMAAFTTIVMFLLGEKKVTRPVLCGQSTYFENKSIITQLFSDRLTIIPESDTQAIITAIDTLQPSVIFLDSLTNAPDIAMPDLDQIIGHIAKHAKAETYLVIDNTGLSIYLQPLKHFMWRRTNMRLIVFESLNKYHQFGMDRVTGGIVWSWGKETDKLFDYRVHSGTNITDITAASIPTPNRAVLQARLLRHGRNAKYLAQEIHSWIAQHPDGPLTRIIYPSLPNHPAYSFMRDRPFCGSYITLQFTKRLANIRAYKRFVDLSLTNAKKENVDLVSGTSFGLNTTRIYLTAVRSKPTMPFIRIAAGTEHTSAMQTLSTVFLQTLAEFN